ncbi:MAG: hypothetical protein PF904_04580 [Kiritimatiellae bacterium]|jgi:hypothetical protein|nr:hypothetical protein [Kiritimatiellia bacterium]
MWKINSVLAVALALSATTLQAVTIWKDAVDGDWNVAANWTGGVPAVNNPAFMTNTAASYSVSVDSEPADVMTNLTIKTAPGLTTTLDITAPIAFTNAWLALSTGAVVRVGQGGELNYNGTNATTVSSDQTVKIFDGAQLFIDGGLCNLTNYTGQFRIEGAGSLTSRLTIASGMFRYLQQYNQNGIRILTGGCIEMTGGIFDATPYPHWSSVIYQDYGVIDIAGDAVFYLRGYGTLGSGETRFSANSTLHFGGSGRQKIKPNRAGDTARVVLTDNARITGGGDRFSVGTGRAGSWSILRFEGTNTSSLGLTLNIGATQGYGEVDILDGYVSVRSYGVRVGCQEDATISDAAPTGTLRVAGGALKVDGGAAGWNKGQFTGLIVGSGNTTVVGSPSFYRGYMYVSGGVVSNTAGFFSVGAGQAEGDVLQTGGEVRLTSSYVGSIGLAGGTGRYILSNGVFTALSTIYVGGATTNALDRYLTNYPADRHDAQGLLKVAGGSFATTGNLILGADGDGVLELGPTGTVTAANVVFSNATSSVVKFMFDEKGTGLLTTSGALQVAEGAKLEIDSRAYTGNNFRVPLVSFASQEGEFDAENITVLGSATLKQAPAGLYLCFHGTLIMVQ